MIPRRAPGAALAPINGAGRYRALEADKRRTAVEERRSD
jgi:hypothetical protein